MNKKVKQTMIGGTISFVVPFKWTVLKHAQLWTESSWSYFVIM